MLINILKNKLLIYLYDTSDMLFRFYLFGYMYFSARKVPKAWGVAFPPTPLNASWAESLGPTVCDTAHSTWVIVCPKPSAASKPPNFLHLFS